MPAAVRRAEAKDSSRVVRQRRGFSPPSLLFFVFYGVRGE